MKTRLLANAQTSKGGLQRVALAYAPAAPPDFAVGCRCDTARAASAFIAAIMASTLSGSACSADLGPALPGPPRPASMLLPAASPDLARPAALRCCVRLLRIMYIPSKAAHQAGRLSEHSHCPADPVLLPASRRLSHGSAETSLWTVIQVDGGWRARDYLQQ